MNNFVRNIDPAKLLFFDIETASRNKDVKKGTKEFELFSYSLRNKETMEEPETKIVKQKYKQLAALKPEFNRIVCISVGFIKDSKLHYKSFTGKQENIIKDFYTLLNNTGLTPCGHNIIGFDMPTIRLKAFELCIDLKKYLRNDLSDSMQKPWILEEKLIDTMSIAKGTYFYNQSLDSLCMLAGIESPKKELKGSKVSETYYKGDIDKIAKYCEQDVIAVAKLFLKLQGNGVEIKETIKREDTPKSTKNELQKMIINNEPSDKLIEKIKELKDKGEDIKVLKDIFTAHYLKPKSRKKEIEQDLERVKEIFEDFCNYEK